MMFASVFASKACSVVNSRVSAPRKRRVLLAFLCALAIVLVGGLSVLTDIKNVLAFNEENPAAFFRADRALQQQRSAAARGSVPAAAAQPATTFRALNVNVPATPASLENRAALKKKKNDDVGKARLAKASGEESRKPAGEHTGGSGSHSVCVRLCDGYHFPIGNAPESGGIAAHEAVCSATCPGAPTRVFIMPSGTDDISRAYSAREGRSYSALPVALHHADKHDNTCTCRRNNESQMSLVSLYRDFTLRSGDAVMTEAGFRVFKGGRQWPFQSRDFATLSASKLGTSERRILGGMERASVRANNSSPRERPLAMPRTTETPLPALGPFRVNRPVAGMPANGDIAASGEVHGNAAQ